MVTLVKHEWHQVDSQFALEFTKDMLEEIYPDMDEDELEKLWQEVEGGEADIDTIIEDAWNNDVELEWDRQYDDWWTDRKGGYDITYEYGDEDSWRHEPPPPEPTHKCTKCKWKGQSYDAEWCWEDKDGNEINDPRKICPYCESDVELTEAGLEEQKQDEERRKRWADEGVFDDDELDFSDVEQPLHAECTSCDWSGPEADTQTIEGQMCCPECREPVMTAEQVDEQRQQEMKEALQELKDEFDKLVADEGNTKNEG